jgi:protein gp37
LLNKWAPITGIPPWTFTGPWPLPNVWLGVSVEDQKWADIRIPQLLMTPAAVRFLSCEPLLGPVALTRVAYTDGGGTHLDVVNGRHGVPDVWAADAKRIDWVIVGGESGPGARPMHPDWARQIRDNCTEAGVPFHFKQWGGRTPKTGGRELDGRTWDEFPAVADA